MNALRYLLLITLVSVSNQLWSQPSDELFANGFARYTELGSDVYIGGLFLGLPSADPRSIRAFERKRMEIKVTTYSLSSRRFARMFVKNAAINNPPKKLMDNAVAMEEFLSWFKGNLEKGDHVVLESTPTGFELSINSVKLAAIQSEDLFNMLLNTWIGEVPPSRDFKTKILGDSRGNEIENAFAAIRPNEQRVSEVLAWKDREENQASEEANTKIEEEQLAQAQIKAAEEAKQVAVEIAKKQKAEAARIAAAKKKAAAEARARRIAAEKAKRVAENEFSAENLLAEQLYANKLMVHSQRRMEYPDLARRLKQQGRVVVKVTINRKGKLVDYQLSQESKYSPLNNAAKKGVRKAAPYPQIPDQIEGDTFEFQVPVTFKYSS